METEVLVKRIIKGIVKAVAVDRAAGRIPTRYSVANLTDTAICDEVVTGLSEQGYTASYKLVTGETKQARVLFTVQ